MAYGDIILGPRGNMCVDDDGKIILCPKIYKIVVVEGGTEYDLPDWIRSFQSVNDVIHSGSLREEKLTSITSGYSIYQSPSTGEVTETPISRSSSSTINYSDLNYFNFNFNNSPENQFAHAVFSMAYQYWPQWNWDGTLYYNFDFTVNTQVSANAKSGCHVSYCSLKNNGRYSNGIAITPGTLSIMFDCTYLYKASSSYQYNATGICSKTDPVDWMGHHWLNSIERGESYSYEINWDRDAFVTVNWDIEKLGNDLTIGSPYIYSIRDRGGNVSVPVYYYYNTNYSYDPGVSAQISNLPSIILKEID